MRRRAFESYLTEHSCFFIPAFTADESKHPVGTEGLQTIGKERGRKEEKSAFQNKACAGSQKQPSTIILPEEGRGGELGGRRGCHPLPPICNQEEAQLATSWPASSGAHLGLFRGSPGLASLAKLLPASPGPPLLLLSLTAPHHS